MTILAVSGILGPPKSENIQLTLHQFHCHRIQSIRPSSPQPPTPSPIPFASLHFTSFYALALTTTKQLPQHHLEQRVLLDGHLVGDLAFTLAVAGQGGDGRERLGDGAGAEGVGQVGEVGVVFFEGL